MATQEPTDFSQPKNELSDFAERERKKLLPKNNFGKGNQYSSTNKDALADGDENGKGTGNFLDIHNNSAGASKDIQERNITLAINEYKQNNPYVTPSV